MFKNGCVGNSSKLYV